MFVTVLFVTAVCSTSTLTASGDKISQLESRLVYLENRLALLEKGSQLKKRFLVDDGVAFFARLDEKELTGVAQNQTILFDKIVLNAGSAFDMSTGQFTAPGDGFYSFSVSVTSDLGHNHQLQVALMKNNDILARAHAHGDSGHLDQGGVSIVVGLAAGDKVYVRSTYDEVTDFYGEGLTTFSGYQVVFK